MHWPMDHKCQILVNALLSEKLIQSVLDPPQVVLSFGASINRQNIVEGTDVYFDWKIEVNTNVYKVEWNKNVSF